MAQSSKSKLSARFFGNKIFFEEHFEQLKDNNFNKKNQKQLFMQLFKCQFSEKEEQYFNYISLIFEFCLQEQYIFDKITCLLELSFHLFQKSMESRMDIQKAFCLFKDCVVRHSLFRPPHCVLIFSLQEIKKITLFFQNTFFKHYLLYLKTFTNKVDIEINTFEMFKVQFLDPLSLDMKFEMNKDQVPEIREYIVDKEIGLTAKELEDIMRGDSIHQVPVSKRLEWQAMKEQRERQVKIEKHLQEQLDQLNVKFQAKIEEQDKAFKEKLDVKNNIKKK